MKFRQVAEIFDLIEQESLRLEMTRLLANLFKKASSIIVKPIINIIGATHTTKISVI